MLTSEKFTERGFKWGHLAGAGNTVICTRRTLRALLYPGIESCLCCSHDCVRPATSLPRDHSAPTILCSGRGDHLHVPTAGWMLLNSSSQCQSNQAPAQNHVFMVSEVCDRPLLCLGQGGKMTSRHPCLWQLESSAVVCLWGMTHIHASVDGKVIFFRSFLHGNSKHTKGNNEIKGVDPQGRPHRVT